MVLHKGLLNRMKFITVGKTLDGEQLFAIQCWQELDAGVYGTKRHTVIRKLGENYRAGTTITLSTTLFRTLATQVLAQKLQDGSRWINIGDFNDLSVENESNATGIRHADQLPLYVE